MNELVDMLLSVSGKYRSRIDRLIEPLSTSFGINAFGYYQIGIDGGITFIGNLPHIQEYYFAEELYKGNPFLKHPDLIQPGLIFADTAASQEFIQAQNTIQSKFGLNKLLLIFEREDDHLYAYGIATTTDDPNMINIYLNNLDKFRGFCHYFRNEAADLQSILDASQVNMPQIVGQEFYLGENKKKLSLERSEQRKLLQQLRLLDWRQPILKPLSEREMQSLRLLLQGLSASAIAQQLSLSPRTIEHYIENIRNKLNCSSKREIFSFVDTLLSFGFDLSILSC